VIDESVVTEHLQVTLTQVDEAGWQVNSTERLDSWEGAVECT
jgi:hypothetical protein